MNTIVCKACGIEKVTTEFYPDKKTGGFRHKCRPCARAYRADRDAANLDVKAKLAETRRNYNRNPERVKVKSLLAQAIRMGRIAAWPACAIPDCHRTNIEGHHADYSRPLDVVWLCCLHHRQAHTLSKKLETREAYLDRAARLALAWVMKAEDPDAKRCEQHIRTALAIPATTPQYTRD